MARAPGKHGLDQALDFQGVLNDLQDWELLKGTDKKMKKKSQASDLIGENGRSKGKTSAADSSRSGSGQYDFSRNLGAINHLSSSFTTDEVSVDATSEKELAEDYCTEALNLDDHYIKAYSRRATARKELGKLKESIKGENDENYLVKKSVYVKELRNKGTGAGSKYDGQVGNDSPANATPSSNVESVQKNNRTRRQELKTSVIELASQAASRAMAEAAKNITPPNSAYQFEVSWRGFSGDRALQTHLLKVFVLA
uniref:RNA-polymerase II-associated protein 3-like C-terminal domain-containing protein n=1 Tax=Salix viminalis TaxID=40686 RepID=A0A6N2LA31_SALVM